MINENSLVSVRMFNVIDNKLRFIKYVNNDLFGNLDLIVISDFYQAHLVNYNLIFQSEIDDLNALASIFLAKIYVLL